MEREKNENKKKAFFPFFLFFFEHKDNARSGLSRYNVEYGVHSKMIWKKKQSAPIHGRRTARKATTKKKKKTRANNKTISHFHSLLSLKIDEREEEEDKSGNRVAHIAPIAMKCFFFLSFIWIVN